MTTIDFDKWQTITTLDTGAHDPTDGKMCVMEAVAYVAGEPWSDHPQCVSPVIAKFLRTWNDDLSDAETRTRLLAPLIPDVIGTRTTDADEETRAWLATDWLVRVYAPAWLDLTPSLASHATALRALPSLTSPEIAVACQSVIEAADSAALASASAARSAARLAADSAAFAAAFAAALAAAYSAARSAALAAALAAAYSAARLAADSAAYSAARSAAREALAPTVATLQASAVELVRAMCAVGREEGA
jgi:hypothetical protein